MARIAFQRVAILGTGLIGTSLGMALKRLSPVPYIVGFDISGDSRRAASGRKAVDKATSHLPEAVRDADLVIVATPVRTSELIFREIAPLIRAGTVVTDTGSTKRQIMDWAAAILPEGTSFVGGHPMTGRATAGVYDAAADLFENAVYCITPLTSADTKAVEKVVKLVEAIGAIPYFIEPDEHDGLVAGADGDPRMYADICLTNRDQLIRQIDRVTEELASLRQAIERSDETIYDRFLQAQRLHLEWLSGRGAEEAPSFSTDDLKPQSLFLPGKLGDVLRRGGKDKT